MALALAAGTAHAQLSVKASLDSTRLVMGHITAVRLDIVDRADTPATLLVDKEQMPPQVEPVDWVDGDTTDIGNGLVEIKRALIIQSFDSGVYTLPPFCLVSGRDTVRSNKLTIKVEPVDVSQMKDINPIADAIDFEKKWYDFLPDWLVDYWLWMLLAVVVIAGGVAAYLIATRKVKVNIIPQKKKLPPYEIAVRRLNALKEAGLWERGQEKDYYTRLIDILRDYLQERFGINAMEMTSQQIVKALSANEATRMPNRHMRNIVEIADFVKFAKARPLPDDNVKAFNNAMQFVEETRPAPEPEAEGTGGSAAVTGTQAPAPAQAPSDGTNLKNGKEDSSCN